MPTYTIYYDVKIDGRWQCRAFPNSGGWTQVEHARLDAMSTLRGQQYPMLAAHVVDDATETVELTIRLRGGLRADREVELQEEVPV